MTLVFQCGSHPQLSHAEIISRLPQFSSGRMLADHFFVVPQCSESPAWLMGQLGGVVKILEVLEDVSQKPGDLVVQLAEHIIRANTERQKVVFGVSIANAGEFKGLGIALKREIQALTGGERPVRSVVSRDSLLSSATVVLEKLLAPSGIDITILKDSSQVLVCQTVAVQPFDEWSFRDFGRPGRDAKRGMLPPKLAKIMLNLAIGSAPAPEKLAVYDPFCGSGTVLTEAVLAGFGRVCGSDILKKAVDDSRSALAWAEKQLDIGATKAEVFKHDATQPLDHIKPQSVDCIVSEPFLGRPLKKGERLSAIEKKQLVALYNNSLRAFVPVLAPDGRVVLSLPFQTNPLELLPLDEIVAQTGLAVDPLLPDQHTILYQRPDQRTGRQVVRLKKAK